MARFLYERVAGGSMPYRTILANQIQPGNVRVDDQPHSTPGKARM